MSVYFNFPISFNGMLWKYNNKGELDLRNNVIMYTSNIMHFSVYDTWDVAYSGYYEEEYEEFADFAEYYKAHTSARFGITFNSPAEAYSNGRRLKENLWGNTPFSGISKDILFDFYKHPESKTKYSVLLLSAHIALHSIIGKRKGFARTNFDLLAARMAGLKTPKDLCDYPEPIRELFSKEYRRSKLIESLCLYWGLQYYSARGIRGFYVSYSMSFEDLCRTAECNRRSLKTSLRKSDKKAIQQRVLAELHDLNKARP